MANENTNLRYRNWVAIVYPESAPADWKEHLDSQNLRWACSPLHDKDINDDSEKTLKKAHWHIVVAYSGKKSFEQVRADLEYLNCPIPQPCRDIRSSVRYFIHKDHPHKFQYSENDIETFGGFDLSDYLGFTKSEISQIRFEMAEYIEEHNVIELFDFDAYCRRNKPDTWYKVLSENSTIYFDKLIRSNRHRQRNFQTDSNGNVVEVDNDGVIKE